ncbi:proteasome subunit alpha type-2-like [Miscanthus floridulus]|uniref:proteasome subunit alpha type-2-like n=1 Tax=Miscanthus floridulus TaxID=154761 RepID=UPI003458A982
MGDSQYSSLTTFSPSGKLVQIEHALTAVGSGQTSLGIKAANGVVIATEKITGIYTICGVRPFGVSLLIAGYDDNGPQLYQDVYLHNFRTTDIVGYFFSFSWKASAMGKNVSNAKTFLEKRYTEDMELDDAIHTAILTLKEGYEGQISSNNIEIGIIRADHEFKVLSPAEIKDFLEEVE